MKYYQTTNNNSLSLANAKVNNSKVFNLSNGDVLRIPYVAATDYREGACGSLTAWVQDPEGNEIELMQYTPVSMQVMCNQ